METRPHADGIISSYILEYQLNVKKILTQIVIIHSIQAENTEMAYFRVAT